MVDVLYVGKIKDKVGVLIIKRMAGDGMVLHVVLCDVLNKYSFAFGSYNPDAVIIDP